MTVHTAPIRAPIAGLTRNAAYELRRLDWLETWTRPYAPGRAKFLAEIGLARRDGNRFKVSPEGRLAVKHGSLAAADGWPGRR